MIMESHLSIAKREAKEKGLVFFPHHETNMSQVIRDAKSLDEAVEYLFGYVTNIRNMYNSEIQALRAKVASADVLVEALRTIRHNAYMDGSNNKTICDIFKVSDKAIMTYDKISEVKHE